MTASAVPPVPTDKPPAEETADRYAGLPESWSPSACETYAAVSEDVPALTAAGRASLYEACALLALADECETTARAEGLTSSGSMGQPVQHPLLATATSARSTALVALRAFGVTGAGSGAAASHAGRALAAARHGRRA